MREKSGSAELRALAESLVTFGKVSGADEIEVSVFDGLEFSADVRMGEVENLVEAGSRVLSLRVIKDKKTAFATSSDLSKDTLQQLIKNAVERAALANSDECAGLPSSHSRFAEAASLRLYDPEIPRMDPRKKIELALQTEKIALEDKRITNSHGASFITHETTTILANSNDLLEDYDHTYCSLSVGLQAGETDSRVEDYWFSSQTHFKDLESPEVIARRAVERTVRQLNPRKIKTQRVPVVFEPLMTSWMLGFLFACISGTSIYQKASFLVDRLGESIADGKINVVDDGLLPGRLGSRPFDSEGVPSQRTIVVEKGVLKNYLCNTYAARKLKLQSTGNSDGTGVSPTNFFLEPGRSTPEDIISSLEKGLVLTRTIGHGLNPVTGDISRGAYGLWVENGTIVYPVAEITIAGNLGEVLKNVEMLGTDLEFWSPVCGPTIKVRELTVAGE